MTTRSTDSPRPIDDALPLDFDVVGMTCANCVRRVETALRAVPGVASADVNFATSRASVVAGTAIADGALVEAVREAGYELRPRPGTIAPAPAGGGTPHVANPVDTERRSLRRDVVIAAIAGLPVLVLGMAHGAIGFADTEAGRALVLALTSIVVFGPGARFLKLAVAAARHRTADMNTLVSVGVMAAYLHSAVAVLVPSAFAHADHARPHLYFEAAVAIVVFVLIGKLLETRARHGLADAVRGLVSLHPTHANRIRDGREESVATDTLVVGDEVVVRPGERIPADGTITEGSSTIDEAMLTGESIPVDKVSSDPVVAGTTNLTGSFRFRVTGVGRETALARIIAAVERAQGSRAPIARLADVVSARFVPVVFGIAALTFAIHAALDPSALGFASALEHFVAVLVIACPCALGLATPAAVAVGTGRGAELGILVRGGEAIETASRVDTVFFDKTGTLTRGEPQLVHVANRSSLSDSDFLAQVASIEAGSEHPLARALVAAARDRSIALDPVDRFRAEAGGGVVGTIRGDEIRVGRRSFAAAGLSPDDALDREAVERESRGESTAFVSIGGTVVGFVAVADRPRDEAARTVAALHALGIEVAMVTGDREPTAKAIARELGIDRVYAEMRPEEKAAAIDAERARGRVVAFIGDGINDAPALASADLGLAVATATDIAGAAADVILSRRGIDSVVTALSLARATLRTIRQNLFWAFVYNLVGIPIAAGALESLLGLRLSPVVASAAMSLSSVSVLWNSMRLRRFAKAE